MTARTTTAIAPDLYDRLKTLATEENRTVRTVTERIIRDALDGTKSANFTREDLLTIRRSPNVRVYINRGDMISVRNTESEDSGDEQGSLHGIAVFDPRDIPALILNLQELDREFRDSEGEDA